MIRRLWRNGIPVNETEEKPFFQKALVVMMKQDGNQENCQRCATLDEIMAAEKCKFKSKLPILMCNSKKGSLVMRTSS